MGTTIIDILKKELVGKSYNVLISNKDITQSTMVYVKKSKNVTDKQFANGINPKFRMESHRNVYLGSHKVFEDHKIIDIVWVHDYDYYGESYSLDLVLENGMKIPLTPDNEKLIKNN